MNLIMNAIKKTNKQKLLVKYLIGFISITNYFIYQLFLFFISNLTFK